MPDFFHYPSRSTEIWLPLVFSDDNLTNRGNHYLQAIARLKPGVTLQQAEEQMKALARGIEEKYPNEQTGRSINLLSLQDDMVQNIRPALLTLLGAVGLVLLIACTNVANLLLARAAGRRREIAIRTALGAGRGRLIKQLLSESLILSILGGALGFLCAQWGIGLLVTMATGVLPRAGEVGTDWRVVAFSLLLSLLTSIIFGLAPAIQMSKINVQAALKDGGRSGDGPQSNWLRGALVVSEIALSLVLLTGAGLLIKSFLRLHQTASGLNPENVLTMGLSLPQSKYATPQKAAIFHQQMLERVSHLPGVEAAGLISLLPLQQWGTNGSFQVEGRAPFAPGEEPIAEKRLISSDYFTAFRIPLLAGRFFDSRDQENSTPVVIINQTFARQYLGDENPIGRRIDVIDDAGWRVIVGVVGDVRQSGLTRPPMPEIFTSLSQPSPAPLNRITNVSLIVRATAEPAKLTSEIRSAISAVDPAQPIHNNKIMEEVIADSVSDRKLTITLLSIFAAVALLLAIIGIYSVMSYTVTQNTKEIGIRLALGAQKADILRLVVGQGMVLTLTGIGVGIVGAFALTRLLASLLNGISATDPLIFAAVSSLLTIVALLACSIPALRAIKVDPIWALRYE